LSGRTHTHTDGIDLSAWSTLVFDNETRVIVLRYRYTSYTSVCKWGNFVTQ